MHGVPPLRERARAGETSLEAARALRRSRRTGARVTVVLLLMLALVTLLGTFAAAQHGVVAAQARFFDSFVAWHDLAFGARLPLPGARLLLWLLLATLILNRAAWLPRRGHRSVIAVHAAVAFLLGAAVLVPRAQQEGTLWLVPREVVRTFDGADGKVTRLPFGLRLISHRRTFHPGTELIASVEGMVEIVAEGAEPIAARITPNQPLRRDGYSIYLPTTRTDPPTALGATRFVAARCVNPTALLLLGALLGCALAWHFAIALGRHLRLTPWVGRGAAAPSTSPRSPREQPARSAPRLRQAAGCRPS